MDNRYPIGKFTWTPGNSPQQRAAAIDDIAAAPAKMRFRSFGLERCPARYTLPRRRLDCASGGPPRADSHVNSYIRFKFALTENEPTIKPYDENVWATLIDATTLPVEPSLRLLEGLHERWAAFLRSLSEADVKRKFTHPEIGTITVDQYLSLYAWHSKHHVAHITTLREMKGW
jgi:hypothetical protein